MEYQKKSSYELRQGMHLYIKEKRMTAMNENLTDELAAYMLSTRPHWREFFTVIPPVAEKSGGSDPGPGPGPAAAAVKQKKNKKVKK